MSEDKAYEDGYHDGFEDGKYYASRELAKCRELVRDMLPFVATFGRCPDRECFMFEECVALADERCNVDERLEERVRDLGIDVR